jgi:hypothetical protein
MLMDEVQPCDLLSFRAHYAVALGACASAARRLCLTAAGLGVRTRRVREQPVAR